MASLRLGREGYDDPLIAREKIERRMKQTHLSAALESAREWYCLSRPIKAPPPIPMDGILSGFWHRS